jgi:hypothetical protein
MSLYDIIYVLFFFVVDFIFMKSAASLTFSPILFKVTA